MGRGGLWVLWVVGVLALCENPEADVTSLGRVALKGGQLLVTFHGDPRYSQEWTETHPFFLSVFHCLGWASLSTQMGSCLSYILCGLVGICQSTHNS